MNHQPHKVHARQRTSTRLSALPVRRRRPTKRAGLLMVLFAVLICFGGVLVGAGPAYAAGPYSAPTISNCPNAGQTAAPTNTAGDANFKIWTCGNDTSAAEAVLNIAENYYPAMTAMMGPPRPDSGSAAEGGDSRIDIYLVSSAANQQVTRYDDSTGVKTTSTIGINPKTGAREVAETNDTDQVGTISSAWMALDINALSTSAFDSNFVHEFFHVLQDAYNVGRCSKQLNWFVEASATWAESHFVPATALTEVYNRFINGFERSPEMSLTSTAKDPSLASHAYSSFIWPYFMQQETGGIAAIANAWKAMKGRTTCTGMNNAINSVLPFQENFGDFALENFDSPLPNIGNSTVSAWPTGFERMYQQVDSNFPKALPKETTATPALNTPTSKPVKVADLATQYNQWKTGLTNLGMSIEFNFSGITNRQNLDIIAVAAEKNHYHPHTSRPFLVIPVPESSNYLRICAPADSPTNDFTQGIRVHLILANHSIASGGKVGGSYTVTPRITCAASASGNYNETWIYNFTDSNGNAQTSSETLSLANITFTPATRNDYGDYGWKLDPTQGTYSLNQSDTFPQPTTCNDSGPISGLGATADGPPIIDAWDFNFPNPQQPTFYISGVSTPHCGIIGGVCPLTNWRNGSTGTYVNNFQAVDFTCTDSEVAVAGTIQASISGSIQAQDPISCGIWGWADSGCNDLTDPPPSTNSVTIPDHVRSPSLLQR
jgi:hypothetical protein